MEAHVHGFGSFGLDFVIGDCFGHGIVGLERCGWLLVTEFHKYDAYVDGFLSGDEQGG